MTTKATPEAVVLSPEARVARLAALKAEDKALKAWEKDGRKGDRPATPTLDAANGGQKVKVAGSKTPKAEQDEGPVRAAIAAVWAKDPTIWPKNLSKIIESTTGKKFSNVRAIARKMQAEKVGASVNEAMEVFKAERKATKAAARAIAPKPAKPKVVKPPKPDKPAKVAKATPDKPKKMSPAKAAVTKAVNKALAAGGEPVVEVPPPTKVAVLADHRAKVDAAAAAADRRAKKTAK